MPKLTTTKQAIQHVNCLVYGDSGVGKTRLISTAPSPLIISAEKGLMSLKEFDIPAFEVTNRSEIDEIYDWIKGSKEAEEYSTICLDSISDIAEVLLSQLKLGTKDPRKAYGQMAEDMAALLRGFRNLDKNTYFTAKSRKIVDETTGVITYVPSVPGQQLLNELPYLFDVVMLFVKKRQDGKIVRYLDTVGDLQYTAKDRSDSLDEIEKPDLSNIFNKILTKQEN